MFAARCVGILLAGFLLLYVPASLLVSRAWPSLQRVARLRAARTAASWLFVLRMFPFVLASVFTLGFTLPSFLLLEPRSTDEAVGTLPLMLGFCCLALLAVGIFRAVRAQKRTSRALAQWLDGSRMLECESALPVFRTGNGAPSLTVAGFREPKLLVSEAAIAALTAPELRTALRHEMAHARSWDNLKKLLFRFSFFPGMARLECAWSEQSELAADDAAVSCLQDALDLAGALIKVSRLTVSQPQPEFTTGLLHSSTALGVRVQRLVSWDREPAPVDGSSYWRYALPSLTGALFFVVTTYGSVLTRLHQATEWLVR